MRIYPGWIKTTLKEDREYYRAILDALSNGPNDEQLAVLARVKFHHLDHNRDLRSELYERFLEVLRELKVPLPSHKINPYDPEAGTWYVIPANGKTYDGKTQDQRLARRYAQRQRLWQAELDAHEFHTANVELYLAQPDELLGEIRDELFILIDDVETRLRKAIDAHQSEINELNIRLDEVHSTLSNFSISEPVSNC